MSSRALLLSHVCICPHRVQWYSYPRKSSRSNASPVILIPVFTGSFVVGQVITIGLTAVTPFYLSPVGIVASNSHFEILLRRLWELAVVSRAEQEELSTRSSSSIPSSHLFACCSSSCTGQDGAGWRGWMLRPAVRAQQLARHRTPLLQNENCCQPSILLDKGTGCVYTPPILQGGKRSKLLAGDTFG